jgi:hypothetical protein
MERSRTAGRFLRLRYSSRPTLEALERRDLLANCRWTGAFGDGQWTQRFNWANLTVPGLRAFGKKEFHVVRNPKQINEHANRRKAS